MTRKKNKTPDIQGELIGQLGYPKHLAHRAQHRQQPQRTRHERPRHAGHVAGKLYQLEVSEALISSVTDAVLDNVHAWQSRPLAAQRAENQRLIPD